MLNGYMEYCDLYQLATDLKKENEMLKARLLSKETKGVSFHIRSNKWTAYIYKFGKQEWLGYFDSFEEAKAAKDNAESIYKQLEEIF